MGNLGRCKPTGACVLALNHEYLAQDERQALKEGDEVAVIPPSAGANNFRKYSLLQCTEATPHTGIQQDSG